MNAARLIAFHRNSDRAENACDVSSLRWRIWVTTRARIRFFTLRRGQNENSTAPVVICYFQSGLALVNLENSRGMWVI